MKAKIQRQSREELVAKFPLDDLVAGWYFKCDEVSVGHYVAEGVDGWGRRVSRSGSEPEQLLKECAEDARQISSN